MPPPAPKTSKQKTGFAFGGLGDLDSESDQEEDQADGEQQDGS